MDIYEKIAQLPNVPPIIPNESELAYIGLERLNYKGLSLWLRNLIAGERLSPEAVEQFGIMEPVARLWKARFDLIVGLVARHRVLCIATPLELLYIAIKSRAQLKTESFFAGDSVRKSKNSFFDANQKFLDSIEGIDPDLESKPTIPKRFLCCDPWSNLAEQAKELARKDDYFNRVVFEPWLNTERRLTREIRRSTLPVVTYHTGVPKLSR